MRVYKIDNTIVIDNPKHNFNDEYLTDKEIKKILDNKEIYDYLIEQLSVFYTSTDDIITFILNGEKLLYYKDDFINLVKKMPILSISPIKKRKFLKDISSENSYKRIKNKYLNKKYDSLTGYDILEIYLSDNPLEKCKNKNISFSNFLEILNNNNLINIIYALKIPEVENDNNRKNRQLFYNKMNKTFANFSYKKIWELYTPNLDEFEKRLKEIGLSFCDLFNNNPKIYFRDEYDWAKNNLVGFKDFFNTLEDISEEYNKGIYLTPSDTKQDFLQKYQIAPEIEEKFIKELENLDEFNLTDLQKSYYLYRRICQKFSYDDEIFATHESQNNKPHGNFSRISEFNFKNNLVICYDIAFIYAKLCNKIGLNVELRDKHQGAWIYYSSYNHDHPHVILWIDDYLISADPSAAKINNDMVNEKNGMIATEFKCINNNDRIKSKFSKELYLVDQILVKKEKDYEYYDLNDFLKKYIGINELDDNELEQIFIDIIRNINMMPGTMMAKMRAFLNLQHRFPKNFRDNIFINAITDYDPINKDNKANLGFVIVIVTNNSKNYYIIKSQGNVSKISESDLSDLIEKGIIAYVDKDRAESDEKAISSKIK